MDKKKQKKQEIPKIQIPIEKIAGEILFEKEIRIKVLTDQNKLLVSELQKITAERDALKSQFEDFVSDKKSAAKRPDGSGKNSK